MQDEIKQPKDYVSMSTRLPSVDAVKLKFHCKRNGVSPSEFIRDIVHEKMNESPISHLAGSNKIEYDLQKDSFVWKVVGDDGQNYEIMKNIGIELLEDLSREIKFQINKRRDLIGKKSKESVTIPRRLVKK
ncbi:MAG: hypothetical protein ABIH65_03440 [Nanoarchaeota archaeon]